MEDTLAFVMAGGQGERLKPLTDVRAKPAVPFGGIFRIIDFTLSNCVNSGLRRIFVLTQYKSYSLSNHLKTGWNMFSSRLDQFIDEVPAQQQRAGAAGTRERPTRSGRTRTSSRTSARGWRSSSRAITSTRWTTGSSGPSTTRSMPVSRSPASGSRRKRLRGTSA